MSSSRPPSQGDAHLSLPMTGSYERPAAEKVISYHAGTVLEDGLDTDDSVSLSGVECENAKVAFQNVGDGASLDIAGVRRALESLNMKLDEELFERLVEKRWEGEAKTSSDGVDCEHFLRIYSFVLTPAIVFGQHLRKAAGRGDEAIVRELINRGCNPNTGSGTGETALHTMAAHGQVECAKAFKALCGHELMIEPRDKAGWTPLMVASGNGHTPFMRFLLDEGASPDVANGVGRTAMHRAAARGRENALKTLISRKAEVNCKDACGYTPLHLAAMHDEGASMRILLEAGADAAERDILGYLPRHYCSDRFWQKLIDDRTTRK